MTTLDACFLSLFSWCFESMGAGPPPPHSVIVPGGSHANSAYNIRQGRGLGGSWALAVTRQCVWACWAGSAAGFGTASLQSPLPEPRSA